VDCARKSITRGFDDAPSRYAKLDQIVVSLEEKGDFRCIVDQQIFEDVYQLWRDIDDDMAEPWITAKGDFICETSLDKA
jgi:hypothetical protein